MERIDPAAIELPATQPIDITFLLGGDAEAIEVEKE
jgi:hypothetical protein